MGSRRDAREAAVQILFQLDFNPGDLEPAMNAFWEERKTTAKVRTFVEELVRGVVANRAEIDALIERFAQNWNLARMAGVDRNIIRLAVFEMLHKDEIPHAVSINEAVELAKNMGDVGSGRFVNGLLDRVRRDLESNGAGQPAAGEA